jgi:ABC-2 type transport system permease protein
MSRALDAPERPGRARLRRGPALGPTWTLFRLTLLRMVASRRFGVLVALYALPILLLLIVRQSTILAPQNVELGFALTMFPHTLLPISALLYAPGLIQDEVEEQTLTYLLVRPIPRWLIFAAKLAASAVGTILLAVVFAGLVEVVVWWDVPAAMAGLPVRAGTLGLIFALALLAYNALFAFVGLMIRKSLAFGMMYILLFEGLFASMDFVLRRATVMFYLRVLALRWLGVPNELWSIKLETAPEADECVRTLLVATVALAVASAWVFTVREFRVKTPEAT